MVAEQNKSENLAIIGSTEYVSVAGIDRIPAKIDTGADTSSIWASSIDMSEDGVLSFVLFNEKSPLFTGERLSTTDYAIKAVRSSHGDEQIRYRVKLPLSIGNKTFTTTFTLANRSRNNFGVLIGRRTLDGNFLVDVSKSSIERHSTPTTSHLNREMKQDPYAFHRKYLKTKEHK